MSRFGTWTSDGDLPVFRYDADHERMDDAEWDPLVRPPTRMHSLAVGNRRIQLVATNAGTVGFFTESDGLRFLIAPDPGSGVSVVEEADGTTWGSAFAGRGDGGVPVRYFGPTWFRVVSSHRGVRLDRTMLCPEGEAGWVLVRVSLTADAPRRVRHIERWTLDPRFVNLGGSDALRADDAGKAVRFRVARGNGSLRAHEERTEHARELEAARFARVFGRPFDVVLEALGPTKAEPSADGRTLRLVTIVDPDPSRETVLWFRFGLADDDAPDDPEAAWHGSLEGLRARLPRARCPRFPAAERELPWHAALLTGGACTDELIGGHTLDQASAYSYDMGFNGAARDPLQHALPLVYSEPDLALSVLRNTCAWATESGDLPYALDGAKQPWTSVWQPSDQNLWAFWLAAEYAAATGDLGAFDAPLSYHPVHRAEPVPLREHLRRQFRFFVDEVGIGAHGHVRMRNADWNDSAVVYSGAPRDEMVARGESVLNSAFAAWTLPVFAGLCDRLGDTAMAGEARTLGSELRDRVAADWTGRWFTRAYAPDGRAIGTDDLWLEVQPWAILCGAAGDERARELLQTIDEVCRRESPLGARVRAPGRPGEGTDGGVWFSINMTLVWAAARLEPELAWDEWRRMSLHAHTAAYPHVWEGTLSGPDAYNTPESPRPGRTWGSGRVAMQSWPVNNLHAHAQPLLAYLRLLGVEPLPDGALAVGGGEEFRSGTFEVRADGSGRLSACGPVLVRSPRGEVTGGPGEVSW